MAGAAGEAARGNGRRIRIVAWSMAAGLLLLPLVAMQFTDEVDWDGTDFIVMGLLIGGVGLAYELAVRISSHWAYRTAAGVALAGSFLLVWITLAVGIIGSEDHPANLMFAGVLVVGMAGSAIALFRPAGMARTLVAMAIAQVLAAVAALAAGWVSLAPLRSPEALVLCGFFAALWLLSAALFSKAGRALPPGDEAASDALALGAQTVASSLLLGLGVVLVALKVQADSEPGAIPLLLVLLAGAWLATVRLRARSRRR